MSPGPEPLWPEWRVFSSSCSVKAFANGPRAFDAGSRRSDRSGWRCGRDDPGSRRRRSGRRTLQTAPDFERVVSIITVTDPRHPLYGQRLKLLSLRCGRGPAYIVVALPDGRRRLLRRAATDLQRPLAPRTVLPLISVRTLLPLARHIRSMLSTSSEEVSHVNSSPAGSSCATAPDAPASIASTPMASAADNAAHAVVATAGPGAPPRPGRGDRSC